MSLAVMLLAALLPVVLVDADAATTPAPRSPAAVSSGAHGDESASPTERSPRETRRYKLARPRTTALDTQVLDPAIAATSGPDTSAATASTEAAPEGESLATPTSSESTPDVAAQVDSGPSSSDAGSSGAAAPPDVIPPTDAVMPTDAVTPTGDDSSDTLSAVAGAPTEPTADPNLSPPAGVTQSAFAAVAAGGVVQLGTTADPVLVLSDGADVAVLEFDAATGRMVVRDASGSPTFARFEFDAPTGSLTIKLGAGDDELRITSLDPAWSAVVRVLGEDGEDAVVVDGRLVTNGGSVELDAERVSVGAGSSIVTRSDSSDSGAITLGAAAGEVEESATGREITLSPGSVLDAGVAPGSTAGAGAIRLVASNQLKVSPGISSNTDLRAAVTVTGGTIRGADVSIAASATDTPIVEGVGQYADPAMAWLFNLLGQLPGIALSALTGISGQVTIRRSTATVDLIDSTIEATGDVSIGTEASADASMHITSINGLAGGGAYAVSVGYGEASATALTTLTRTTIVAAGSVDVTSSATTTAFVKARTTVSPTIFSDPDNVTFAVAVAHTTEISKVVIDAGSVITSGGTVNVAATAEVLTFAWSQPVVNEDGLLTVAFSLNFDTADVRADVAGRITAAGGYDLSFDVVRTADSTSWVDFTTDTIHLPGHGLTEGQEVAYDPGTIIGLLGPDTAEAIGIPKDEDSGEFEPIFVRVIDADTIALTRASAIDLERRLPLFGPASSTQSLGRLADLVVDGPRIDPGSNQIGFGAPHGLSEGAEVQYKGPYLGVPVGIPGLTVGATYVVHVVNPTAIVLRDGNGVEVDLLGAAFGTHGFLFVDKVSAFDPVVAIDADRNTITFTTAHGFSTGDAVEYRTDPTVSGSRPTGTLSLDRSLALTAPSVLEITGDLRGMVLVGQRIVVTVGGIPLDTQVGGVTFDAATNRTVVTLLDPVGGTGAVTAVVTLPGTVQVPDEPVPGLQNGDVYFVVVVDAFTIRLATGVEAARWAATPINLTPPSDLGAVRDDPHSLSVTGCDDGICITAGLSATNAINAAGTIAGGSTTRWADAANTFTANIGSAEELLRQLTLLVTKVATGTLPTGAVGASGIGLAGSVAINRAVHDVVALVAPTAVLTSATGVTVSAAIEQYSQVAVVAGATKQQDGDGQTVAQVALSLAVGVGLFTNTALATVDSGARIDAAGSLGVSSDITYPYLISSPTAAVNPAEYLKTNGPDGIAYFFDGTLGYSSNLFNTWVMTAASQAEVAGGGSVAVLDYVNRSEAVIRDGAVINGSTDPVQLAGDRGVTVEASLTGNFIHIVGVAGLSLHNIVGGVDAWRGAAKSANVGGKLLGSFKSLVNPFGAEGDKAGIGASFLVQLADNRVEARIAPRALVVTGAGGLTVAARTALTDFALAEAGSKASTFAVSGAFTVLELANRTWAHIDAGADVRPGGDVTVAAEDMLDRLAVAGGIVAAEHVGIGIGVGINLVGRDTRAWIDGNGSFAQPIVTPDGSVAVTARNGGALTSIVIGGAVAGSTINNLGEKVEPPTTPDGELAGFDLGGKPSVAVGLSIAVNVVDRSLVRAWVQDRTVAARKLTISAVSDPTLLAVVAAAAFAVDTPSSSATVRGASIDVAIAGALAVNLLTHEVEAALRRTRIGVAEDVMVTATDSGSITVVAGALSVAVNVASMGEARAVGIGGSVAVNDIDTTVSAVVEDSTVTAVGDVTVLADASPAIVSHTYAASLAVAKGAGLGGTDISVSGSGAGSGNRIDRTVTAAVRGSTITARGVVVRAVDAPSILAVAVGIAVAVAGDGVAVGIGIAAASNEILGSVTASVGPSAASASTVTATGFIDGDIARQLAIRVVVESSPVVESYTISGALGGGQGQSAGGAGAGSGNYITSSAVSSVTGGSVLSAALAGVEVSATDMSTITAVAGALAIAAVLSLSGGNRGPPVAVAIGVTVAVNRITADVSAVVDASSVTAAGRIDVLAAARPSIQALTLAGAFGINLAKGGSFSFSGSLVGAIALNDIDDHVEALVRNGASVRSTASGVTIRATMAEGSGIGAIAVGAAASVSSGSGATIGLDVGVAIAVNQIGSGRGNLVLARIIGSTVTAERTVSVVARMSANITALVVAVSLAITISSGQAAVALSGAGAVARNTIGGQVLAEVLAGSAVTAGGAGGWVLVQADERSSIESRVVAATVTVSAATSGASVSGSIAYAESTNTYTTAVRATVTGRSTIQAVQGGVAVVARASSNAAGPERFFAGAAALSVGVSITNPVQGVAVGLAGVAALASNTLRGTADVVIDGGALISAGGGGLPAGTACVPGGAGAVSLLVCSFQELTSRAEVIGGAVTLVIGLSAVVAVGLAANTVTVGSQVLIDGATLASNGVVLVSANADVASDVSTLVFAVAIAVGGAGAGARADSTVTGSTRVSVLRGASVTGVGGLTIRARTTVGAAAVSDGGAGSVGSIAVMLADSVVGIATEVLVAESRLASGGPLVVGADQAVRSGRTASSSARLVVGSVAILSGAGGSAQARDRSTVRASILLGTTIVAPASSVTVSATRVGVTDARTTAVNIGILAGLAATVRSVVTGETVARIAPAVAISASSLSVVARADTTATTSQLGVCVGAICVAVSVEAADGQPSAAADDAVLALIGERAATATTPAAVIDVSGAVQVRAGGSRSAEVDTQVGAGGVIAVAVGAVWARSDGATQAFIGSGQVVRAESLTVETFGPTAAGTARNVTATGTIGSGGGIATAVADAMATIAGVTDAAILATASTAGTPTLVITGATRVVAVADNRATARLRGGSGALAVGVTVITVTAEIGPTDGAGRRTGTRAWIEAGTTLATGDLTVSATSADHAVADIPVVAGGSLLLNGQGGTIDATVDTEVSATVGRPRPGLAVGPTVVTATGAVEILSLSTPTATATVVSASGALAGDVADFRPTAEVSGTTTSLVAAETTLLGAASLTLRATNLAGRAGATAQVSGGAGLVSVGSATTVASYVVTVEATVADRVTIGLPTQAGALGPMPGGITVNADAGGVATSSATASGGAGGVRVAGTWATTTMSPTVIARIGTSPADGSAPTTLVRAAGAVEVRAQLVTPSESTATSGGTNGALVAVGTVRSTLTTRPSVLATIHADLLSAGDVFLTAFLDHTAVSTSASTGGGFYSNESRKSRADATATSIARIGDGSSVQGANVYLLAFGRSTVSAVTVSKVDDKETQSGGVAGGVVSDARASLTGDVLAAIGAGARVTAAGLIGIDALSDSDVSTVASGTYIGLFVGVSSNCDWVATGRAGEYDCTFGDDDLGTVGTFVGSATTPRRTAIEIGLGAVLDADKVSLLAQIDRLRAASEATAGAFAASEGFAGANVEVHARAEVVVAGAVGGPQTLVIGRSGVDVQALVQTPEIERRAWSYAVFGGQAARARGTDDIRAAVTTRAGATFRAGPRNAFQSERIDPTGTYQDLALWVRADGPGRSDGVIAQLGLVDVDTGTIRKRTASDFRPAATWPWDVNSSAQARSNVITWDADVEVTSGRRLELIIDRNGVAQPGSSIGVNRVCDDPACTTGYLQVADIFETSFAGSILFQAPGGQITENRDGEFVPGVRYYGTFRFLDGIQDISIRNESDFELRLGAINSISGAGNPRVALQTGLSSVFGLPIGITLNFAIVQSTFPTAIRIDNLGTGDVVLPVIGRRVDPRSPATDGPSAAVPGIENPIGSTSIRNRGGDIVVPAGVRSTVQIRTTKLELIADVGSIGSVVQVGAIEDARFVSVELVRSAGRAPSLVTRSGADTLLMLRARIRDGSTAATEVVTLESITAGGSASVLLLAAIREQGAPGLPSGVRVDINRLGGGTVYRQFFRADESTFPAPALDRGVFVLPGGVLVDTGYVILTAAAVRTTPSARSALNLVGFTEGTRIDITATVLLPSDTGSLEVQTNGDVDITAEDRPGDGIDTSDLPVALVISSAGSVFLNSRTGDIIDVDDPVAADATDVVAARVISLFARQGSVGTAANHLETDLTSDGGWLVSFARSVFVTEVAGTLWINRVLGSDQVVLRAVDGSIRRCADPLCAPGPRRLEDLAGTVITLLAPNGSIGTSDAPLVSSTNSPQVPLVLFVDARDDVALQHLRSTLQVLGVTSRTGSVRLTAAGSNVRVSPERIELLSSGIVDLGQGDQRVVAPTGLGPDGSVRSGVWAAVDVDLIAADEFSSPADTSIIAGRIVRITVDGGGATPDAAGARVELSGVLGGVFDLGATPDPTDIVFVLTGSDADEVRFTETFLGATTRVYTGAAADLVEVVRLQTIPNPDWTLTIDAGAAADTVVVRTTGTAGPDRDYVINVLDTGPATDGQDTLTVEGGEGDDLILMRPVTSVPCVGTECGQELGAVSPAFVAVLHTTEAVAAPATSGRTVSTPWFAIERITYSAGTESLTVNALGGADLIAIDGVAAPTVVDGGAGADRFRVGQMYGTPRTEGDVAAVNAFGTAPTLNGYLSFGTDWPLALVGGDGDDRFDLLANVAAVSIVGDGGNDVAVLRAWLLAVLGVDGRLALDLSDGWATPRADRSSTNRGPVTLDSVERLLRWGPSLLAAPTNGAGRLESSLLSRLENNSALPAPPAPPACPPGPPDTCPPTLCADGSAPPCVPTLCADGSAPPCVPTLCADGSAPPCVPTLCADGSAPPCVPTLCADGSAPPCVPTLCANGLLPPCVPTLCANGSTPPCGTVLPPPDSDGGEPPPEVLTACTGAGCTASPPGRPATGPRPPGSSVRGDAASALPGRSTATGVIAWGGASSGPLTMVGLLLLLLGLLVVATRRRRWQRLP